MHKVNQNEVATATLLSLIKRGKEGRSRRDSSSSSDSDSGNQKFKFVTAHDLDQPNEQSNPFPLKLDQPEKSEEYQSIL